MIDKSFLKKVSGYNHVTHEISAERCRKRKSVIQKDCYTQCNNLIMIVLVEIFCRIKYHSALYVRALVVTRVR